MIIDISSMKKEDASEVAMLAGELGYPVQVDVILSNFNTLKTLPEDEVLVAREQNSNSVLGWLHLQVDFSLIYGRRCEIKGLVVNEKYRGKKIGSELMQKAEEWALTRELDLVIFSSRITRTEAHRLYERLGYKIQKTSHVFSKNLRSRT